MIHLIKQYLVTSHQIQSIVPYSFRWIKLELMFYFHLQTQNAPLTTKTLSVWICSLNDWNKTWGKTQNVQTVEGCSKGGWWQICCHSVWCRWDHCRCVFACCSRVLCVRAFVRVCDYVCTCIHRQKTLESIRLYAASPWNDTTRTISSPKCHPFLTNSH